MVTRRIAKQRQPLIWGLWMRCGVWSSVGSQFSGVPLRTRLLLFEATPSDSLNYIGDPRSFWEGNQNRRHSHHPFPLRDEKILLLETCFSGIPNFILCLCAKIYNLLYNNNKKSYSFPQTCVQRNPKPEICLIILTRRWKLYKHVAITVSYPRITLCFLCTFRSKCCISS